MIKKKKLEIFNISSPGDCHIKVSKLLSLIKKINKKFKFRIVKSKFYETQYLKLNSKKFMSKFNFRASLKINNCIRNTMQWYENCYIGDKKINIYKYSKEQFTIYLKSI
tara:strand:+ start:2075 stop:2401 length:327 start_codon:yes stop_codon:yes gene_type:complete